MTNIATDTAARKPKTQSPAYLFWHEHIRCVSGTPKCMGFTRVGQLCSRNANASFQYSSSYEGAFLDWLRDGAPFPFCRQHGGR